MSFHRALWPIFPRAFHLSTARPHYVGLTMPAITIAAQPAVRAKTSSKSVAIETRDILPSYRWKPTLMPLFQANFYLLSDATADDFKRPAKYSSPSDAAADIISRASAKYTFHLATSRRYFSRHAVFPRASRDRPLGHAIPRHFYRVLLYSAIFAVSTPAAIMPLRPGDTMRDAAKFCIITQ